MPQIPAPVGTSNVLDPSPAVALQAPAMSEREAVERFLDAEISGDFDTSFASLSSDDRASIGDATEWALQHDTTPEYLSFTVLSAADGHVVTDAVIEPRVDEIVGVIAGQATIDWRVVPDRGGYSISLIDTVITPEYPDESLAAATAVRWALALTNGTTLDQYGGTVLVQPDVVAQLRTASGDFTPGETTRLAGWRHATSVTDALGTDATRWARVVRLSGAKPVDVVLAPFGDSWVVVGVAAA